MRLNQLRMGTGCIRGPLKRGVPVWRAHHHPGTVAALQQRGALIMIAMGMADDHIFNVTGICAKAAVHMTSSETANTQNDSVFIMVGT